MSEQFKKAKKGLACCERRGYCEGHCPYYEPEKEALECTSELAHDALALIRHLDERIKELEEGPKWISVKDRLPTESDGTVLICYPNQEPYSQIEPYVNARHDSRVATGHYSQYSHTWYHGDFHAVGGADPIAWMPLPSTEGLNGT